MPSYDTIEEWIRGENSSHQSVGDQVTTAHWFRRRDITVNEDRVARTNQVRDHVRHRLDYSVRTVLDNLEEIGVLEKIDPPGSGSFIRHHRSGENFFDPSSRDFVPYLQEDMAQFIDDMQTQEESVAPIADGGLGDEDEKETNKTLRSVAADALDVDESAVEEELQEPSDPVERMNRYDKAVKAVKASDAVERNRDYDEMGWRNMALRWTLSQRAAGIGG